MGKTDKLVIMIAEKIREIEHGMDLKECDVNQALYERKRLLNAKDNWTWNEENRKRLIEISEALYMNCKKGWEMGMERAAVLEKQMADGDTFFDDYVIVIRVTPYTKLWHASAYVSERAREDVGLYISENCGLYIMNRIWHRNYDEHVKKNNSGTVPFSNRELNWNTEYIYDAFEDDYISEAMHSLLENPTWSFGDICAIERIFLDVNVEYRQSVKK